MIQVCSRCATRWNVRDQQRQWCPRCQGALLAPLTAGAAGPGTPPAAPTATPVAPAGFRWIAVRPGPPPPRRPPRRPLGPTPRYQTIPRWGLIDRTLPTSGAHADERTAAGPSIEAVRAVLLVAGAVFALAAAAHVLRYVLLLINRSTLLPPLVAGAALLAGVLVSLAAIAAVVATAAVLTSWLIARRKAVFRRYTHDDPRPEWALWLGCMTPVVNLVWAPVFLIELAEAENLRQRLRGPITLWWLGWIFSTAVTAWAIWTSTATLPQAVADNTVTVIIAYLAGLAVLVQLWRVFDTFAGKPVERPRHRWVVVAGAPAVAATTDSDARVDSEGDAAGPRDVESEDSEPAA